MRFFVFSFSLARASLLPLLFRFFLFFLFLPYRNPIHRPRPPGDPRRPLPDRSDELGAQFVDRSKISGFGSSSPLLPQHLAAVRDRGRARRARAAAAASASASCSYTCIPSSKEPVELPRAGANVNNPPPFHHQGQQSFGHPPGAAEVCVHCLLCLVSSPGVALEGDRGVVDEDGDFKERLVVGFRERKREDEVEKKRKRKKRKGKEMKNDSSLPFPHLPPAPPLAGSSRTPTQTRRWPRPALRKRPPLSSRAWSGFLRPRPCPSPRSSPSRRRAGRWLRARPRSRGLCPCWRP